VEWLQHGKVGRKTHLACGITGCELDICDGGVARVQRIDRKMGHAFEQLVRANIPK
jgi:hypothetical protein